MNKHHPHFAISFALLALLLIFVTTVAAAPKDGPVVSLSTTQTEFSAGQDVLVTVTYSNPTKHTVRILKWYTPADGLEESVFQVKLNGVPVAYTGAVYKRPAPTGGDYISLKSGESLSYTVNLGETYDLSGSGQYEIAFAAASYNLFEEKGGGFKFRDSLSSEPISLKVEGRLPKVKPTPPPPPPPGSTSFNACTTAQQTILLNARAGATSYASSSENYLFANNTGTPRYVEWFGIFDASRYNTVKSHFTSLSDAWDNAGVTFDCKCKQPYYAYVYPDKPYTIYLCKVFWQAPLTGTDSQSGTLIHEMSHFFVVADTDDYVYGQTGARALAIESPDQAVMNADNHEYFAENTPYLP